MQSGTSDLLSGLTVNDMASALSASPATPPTAKNTSPAVGMGMGPSSSNFGMEPSSSASNHTPSPQFSRPGGFQQTSSSQQQQPLQPTTLQPTPAPTLQPTLPSVTPNSGSTLQPSKYAPSPKQTTLANLSGGMGVQSRYTPPTMRSQQTASVSGGGSGLGDFGLLTGGTGQTNQTGFGGGGGSGILQPTKPQSGPSMMGISDNRSSMSTSGALFSGMQTGGTGGSSFNPQMQGNRSMLNPSSGGSGTMSGAGNTSGLFSGMQMNSNMQQQQQQQQFSNQSLQVGMGGSGGGGGGLLQPLVPTQQQQQQPQPSSGQPIGNASTGWSSNINTQGPLSQASYGGGLQSQSQSATGWSSNIAGSSSMSSGSTGTAGSGWSQNIGGMGMQPMQTGMGPTQMQGGMGMGQSSMGGGATWSTTTSGGGANTGVAFQGGSTLPPTAANLMMGGTGQPLMPQTQQQQQTAANRPAPGANPFADLSFLA